MMTQSSKTICNEAFALASVISLKPVALIEGDVSDEALVRRCGEGHAPSLGGLFDRHQQALFRYVSQRAGVSPQDAEDLVQSTFLQAFRSAKRFRGQSSVKTWLYSIANNLVREFIRGDARLNRAKMRLQLIDDSPGPTQPDNAAQNNELAQHLAAAIKELPDLLREVFVLCEIEGIRGVDAVKILRAPDGTLYRRLYEARQQLKLALGQRGYP